MSSRILDMLEFDSGTFAATLKHNCIHIGNDVPLLLYKGLTAVVLLLKPDSYFSTLEIVIISNPLLSESP